jgi:hypothetical protein
LVILTFDLQPSPLLGRRSTNGEILSAHLAIILTQTPSIRVYVNLWV